MRKMGSEKELQEFMESFSPPEELDEYSKKTLSAKIFDHNNRERIKLADMRYVLDGKKYASIINLIFENTTFENLHVYFVKPNVNETWEYDVPTVEIKISKGGVGTIMLPCPYNPYSLKRWDVEHMTPTEENAMFRVYLLDFYYPESIRNKSLRGDTERIFPFNLDLFLFEDFLKIVRNYGIVPLIIRLCAYTKHYRFTYDIDVIDDALIANFRTGKFPVTARIYRHPKQYYFLDRILASTNIGDYPKKVLETVFETNGVYVHDIAHAYGLSDQMAQGSLEVCVKHGFLEKEGKPPRVRYVPRFENFGGVIEYKPPQPQYETVEKPESKQTPQPTEENPEICPVCGNKKSPEELVCERCARASMITSEEVDAEYIHTANEIFVDATKNETLENESVNKEKQTAVPIEKQKNAHAESIPAVAIENAQSSDANDAIKTESKPESENKKGICPSCGFRTDALICVSCGYRLLDKQI
jgi:hypothetical protein